MSPRTFTNQRIPRTAVAFKPVCLDFDRGTRKVVHK